MSLQNKYDALDDRFNRLAKASVELVQIHQNLLEDYNELVDSTKEEVVYAKELEEEVNNLTDQLALYKQISSNDSLSFFVQEDKIKELQHQIAGMQQVIDELKSSNTDYFSYAMSLEEENDSMALTIHKIDEIISDYYSETKTDGI